MSILHKRQANWVDVTCHLTMGELIDAFGNDVMDMNNSTSRTNIELPFGKLPAKLLEALEDPYRD